QFEVIDRRVVEAIAEAEGTTLEEAAFDGKKLKWSAEARRALRAVPDAYLRRRAKARIEKAARMQRMQTITSDLALPMINETVGSDRLETNGAGEPVAAVTSDGNGTRPVPRPSEPLRTQPGVSDNPTLNWGDGDGNLNEVGAGRVMVTTLPAHGEEDAGRQD
ncbi:MAG: PCP reductase family protein, partial [Candidatus Tectomicrobia bacterium]|nr:PCP reductase family protein [Candidatus Tectomicrobia bacterium]